MGDMKITEELTMRRMSLMTPLRVKTTEELFLRRKTTEMFRQRATKALARNTRNPRLWKASKLNRGSSKMRNMMKFTTKQT